MDTHTCHSQAFTCPQCSRDYGDPLYHGPAPHAPARLCLDCWADQWAEFEARIFNDQEWTVLDEGLWLVSRGLSHSQAAEVIRQHRNGLHNWMVRMRKYPHRVPSWLS